MNKVKSGLCCVVVLLAPLLAGCPASSDSTTPPDGPWSVSLSMSGGFTGGGSSTTIRSDGTATTEAWDTAGAEPVVSDNGVVPAEALAALRKATLDPKLRSLPPGEPGNMTTTLTVESGDSKQSWMYETQTADAAPLSTAVTAFQTALAAATN